MQGSPAVEFASSPVSEEQQQQEQGGLMACEGDRKLSAGRSANDGAAPGPVLHTYYSVEQYSNAEQLALQDCSDVAPLRPIAAAAAAHGLLQRVGSLQRAATAMPGDSSTGPADLDIRPAAAAAAAAGTGAQPAGYAAAGFADSLEQPCEAVAALVARMPDHGSVAAEAATGPFALDLAAQPRLQVSTLPGTTYPIGAGAYTRCTVPGCLDCAQNVMTVQYCNVPGCTECPPPPPHIRAAMRREQLVRQWNLGVTQSGSSADFSAAGSLPEQLTQPPMQYSSLYGRYKSWQSDLAAEQLHDVPQSDVEVAQQYRMPQPDLAAAQQYEMGHEDMASTQQQHDMSQHDLAITQQYQTPQTDLSVTRNYYNAPQRNLATAQHYDIPQRDLAAAQQCYMPQVDVAAAQQQYDPKCIMQYSGPDPSNSAALASAGSFGAPSNSFYANPVEGNSLAVVAGMGGAADAGGPQAPLRRTSSTGTGLKMSPNTSSSTRFASLARTNSFSPDTASVPAAAAAAKGMPGGLDHLSTYNNPPYTSDIYQQQQLPEQYISKQPFKQGAEFASYKLAANAVLAAAVDSDWQQQQQQQAEVMQGSGSTMFAPYGGNSGSIRGVAAMTLSRHLSLPPRADPYSAAFRATPAALSATQSDQYSAFGPPAAPAAASNLPILYGHPDRTGSVTSFSTAMAYSSDSRQSQNLAMIAADRAAKLQGWYSANMAAEAEVAAAAAAARESPGDWQPLQQQQLLEPASQPKLQLPRLLSKEVVARCSPPAGFPDTPRSACLPGPSGVYQPGLAMGTAAAAGLLSMGSGTAGAAAAAAPTAMALAGPVSDRAYVDKLAASLTMYQQPDPAARVQLTQQYNFEHPTPNTGIEIFPANQPVMPSLNIPDSLAADLTDQPPTGPDSLAQTEILTDQAAGPAAAAATDARDSGKFLDDFFRQWSSEEDDICMVDLLAPMGSGNSLGSGDVHEEIEELISMVE